MNEREKSKREREEIKSFETAVGRLKESLEI